MADFTLSGLPLGNAEQFFLDGLAQLTGTFVVDAKLDTPLLQAEASANMSGFVVTTVTGLLSATSTFFGNVDFATAVQGQRDALGLVGGGFIDVVSGVTNVQAGFIPLVAVANLSGNLLVNASISGLLSASGELENGLNYESFIGAGDVLGNELLSAAASANMTGEPDPLKDGGSPAFVAFDGTDQYLFFTDTADGDLRGGSAFSCVVVFDPEYLNNSGSGVLVGKHDPGSTEWGWRVAYDATTGEITVLVSSAADGTDRAERTTAVGSGGIRVRTVFAFTWDGSSLELYVAGSSSQGAQTDVGTPGAMVQGDGQFAIGADDTLTTPANLYQGAIHAVHVFDDVLSSGEAATIDQGGYVPPALIDANLVASWRPDRIEGSVSNVFLTKWRDEGGARHLARSGLPTCFTGILSHRRWVSDDWDMDFLNAEVIGLSNSANLASNYPLSTSSTLFVESGGFRLYQPPTFQTEPEIVSGFRPFLTDFTLIVGARKDTASTTDVTFVEILGLRITYDAATRDLFVFQGDTGTPTRYEFGQDNDFLEADVPGGAATVFILRYNSQLDQFTLFINGIKKFEESTTAIGSPASGTGLRMCAAADWGAINPSASQADRRATQYIPACLPDILIEQILNGIAPDVRSIEPIFYSPLSLRAFLRRNPAPELFFGQIVDVDYPAVREVDDTPPSPAPTFDPFQDGSGTVELDGLPDDGERVTIDDGQGTVVTFEFDDNTDVLPGNVAVPISVTITTTLQTLAAQVAASSLRLTASAPVVFAPDGFNEVGYVRLVQDDLADGDLPLSIVAGGQHAPSTHVRVTGPYRVRGPVGTLELLGQPSDGDQFRVDDRINPAVVFEFESGGGVSGGAVAVTIGATVVDTLDSLVVAVNAATLVLTALSTTEVDATGNGTADGGYTRLVHARSSDPGDYANRVDTPVQVLTNGSGNLAFTGLAQPRPFEESIAQAFPDIRSAEIPVGVYIDSPYDVLEPEDDEGGGVEVPPFINPNPVIVSVTADITKTVTAVALAGPTDAGDVRSWWEIEIVSGDPQFNFRIDEVDNNFSINKQQADTFPVPEGINFDEKRIRFVIQSQVDPDQIWYSLYVRMEGDNFNNEETTVIILPGQGAPETPPQIEITLSLAEQAFVVEEESVGAPRELALSSRSRYKLTRVFINRARNPRIEDRNEEGLEFGLLSVLADFLTLGTDIRTHIVASGDVGFLDRIATKFYGAGFEDFWWVIAYANNIADPDAEMFVGQRLVIPPRERITAFLARKPTPEGA